MVVLMIITPTIIVANNGSCDIKGIFWSYDRKGFAFAKGAGILYFNSNFDYTETVENSLIFRSSKHSAVFSHPKEISISNTSADFWNVSQGITTITVVSTNDVQGATYHDPSGEIIIMYKSMFLNFTTNAFTLYSNDEVQNGRVPTKLQYNVTSKNDFLLLWGDKSLAQFYSLQPLEYVDGHYKFKLNTNKYIYRSIEKLVDCSRTELCIDSRVDGAVMAANDSVTFMIDYLHENDTSCGYGTSVFEYRGKMHIIYETTRCLNESLQGIFSHPSMNGIQPYEIEAAMTIEDKLYLIDGKEVTIFLIAPAAQNAEAFELVKFVEKRDRKHVWPGLPDKIDAVYYNETDGQSYFIKGEYYSTYQGSKRTNGGKLKPIIGNLVNCEYFNYDKYVGKLFKVSTQEEYVSKIVRKRQGCGNQCPEQLGPTKKSDNTILIIIIVVITAILLISVIILLMVVFVTRRRRRNRLNDLSTERNTLWNSDMTNINTEKSKKYETTVNQPKARPVKKKRT